MDRDPLLRTNQHEAKESKLRRAAGAVLGLFRRSEEPEQTDPFDRPDPFKPQIDVIKSDKPEPKDEGWDWEGIDWEDPRTARNGLRPHEWNEPE